MTSFSPITDERVLELDDIYGAQHYNRLREVIRRTEGAWLQL